MAILAFGRSSAGGRGVDRSPSRRAHPSRYDKGGYLLLAPLAGLPPDAALALSLAKRAREILLGLPGLLYLHLAERAGAAATRPLPP